MSTPAPPRVFISYSHDSAGHRQRVLELCERLRADGIDATIDQYVETSGPAEGWPRWMDQQLQTADATILVCTATYRRRLENREEPGRGHGVMWEGHLVYQMIYNAGARNQRFVPVLLADAVPDDIPLLLQGGAYFRPDDDEGYRNLYRRLTGQPRVLVSPLGDLQKLPPQESSLTAPDGRVSSTSTALHSAATSPPRLRTWKGALVVAAVAVAAIASVIGLRMGKPDVYRIRIVVLDAQNELLKNARVTSSSGGELQTTDAGWELVLPSAQRPPDGVISLHASVPSAFLSGEAKVRLDDGERQEVRIRALPMAGATVSGIVIDADQRPVAGVSVSVVGGAETVTTGADGQFTLSTRAATGQMVQLRAVPPDLPPVTQSHPAGTGPATVVIVR